MSRSFKLQIMVNDSLVSRIDTLCNILGCSRSTMGVILLNKGLSVFEKAGVFDDTKDNTEAFQQIKLE